MREARRCCGRGTHPQPAQRLQARPGLLLFPPPLREPSRRPIRALNSSSCADLLARPCPCLPAAPQAVTAINTLNGTELGGRTILVREDREDRDVKQYNEQVLWQYCTVVLYGATGVQHSTISDAALPPLRPLRSAVGPAAPLFSSGLLQYGLLRRFEWPARWACCPGPKAAAACLYTGSPSPHAAALLCLPARRTAWSRCPVRRAPPARPAPAPPPAVAAAAAAPRAARL